MTLKEIKQLVNDEFDAVNQLIIDSVQSQVGLIDDLSHHIINSGGKRLRPLLVLLSAKACGYQGHKHIDLAAAVEYFHTATLLHDDVIDESTLRRGKETANEIWGSKPCILVGDYLFTQSVQLMVSTGDLDILSLLASTSHQISCGEVKQLTNRHHWDIDVKDYFDVIREKTALLFSASTGIGPRLAKMDQNKQQAMDDYGLHLGNAFQLIDDALDYCSNSEAIGKNIGDDLADGKPTLPLIHAMKHGSVQQRALIQTSIEQGSLDQLDQVLEAIKDTQAIEYTTSLAREEVDKAITALEAIDDSEYKDALVQLAHFSIERTH